MNQTEKHAIKILKGIDQIADNEMLKFGSYISNILKPELAEAGAICGGREACLIGSAYLAAGVIGQGFILNGDTLDIFSAEADALGERPRDRFLSDKPALKLAIDALNEVALPYVEKHVEDNEYYDWAEWESSPAEGLFESHCSEWHYLSHNAQRRKVKKLTKKARKRIRESALVVA